MSDAAATMTLIGERVRRIDQPNRHLLVFSLDTRVLVVGLGRRVEAFAFADARPRGEHASGFVTKLRHHLDDARLVGVTSLDTHLHRLDFTHAAHTLALFVDNDPHDARLLLANEQGAPLVTRMRTDESFEITLGAPCATHIENDANALISRSFSLDLDERVTALKRAVRAHAARLSRKLASIQGDIDACASAEALRHDATALASFGDRNARGPITLTLPDAFDETGEATRTITLPIGVRPHERANQLFERARKLELGARIAETRHQETSRDIDAARALTQDLDVFDARDTSAFDALQSRAIALRIKGARQLDDAAPSRGKHTPPKRVPHRTFRGSGGALIYVGKGARDNDELTLHIARPHDLWLHARDVPGAHVVVPLQKKQTCPSELLIDAAHLAAHFSDHRNESVVDIEHVDRRHVRKPKGAPPGLVMVQQAKTLVLRKDAARLARLLAQEE